MKRLLFIPLFLASILSFGQGILKGQILDFDSQQPIAEALISFRNFPALDTLIRADAQGNFSFQGPQANYTMRIRKATYAEKSILVRVEGGDRRELIITLKKKIELDILKKDVMVHTSKRMLASLEDHNESISIMDGEEIFSQNFRTLAAALVATPGIWIESPFLAAASPRIRGLGGNQSLILLDGIRLNHAAVSNTPNLLLNTIDPYIVDQVEVVRGGGATAYGSDALAGVIHIQSLTPKFSTDGRLRARLDGRLQYGGGSFGDQWRHLEQNSRAQLTIEGERVATMLGLTVKDFGHNLAGDSLGIQIPSAYREVNIDFKSKLKIGEKNLLTLAYQRVSIDSARWYSQARPSGDYVFFQTDPLQRSLAYMKIERKNEHPWVARLTLTASFQDFFEEVDSRRKDAFEQISQRESIRSSMLSLVNNSAADKTWTHSSGLEVYLDQLDSEYIIVPDSSEEFITMVGSFPELARSIKAGAFSIHSLKKGKFLLNAGLRYDFILNDGFSDIFGDLLTSSNGLSSHASIAFEAIKGHKLLVQGRSGFRAPNIGDWRSENGPMAALWVPNTELDPERNLGLEGGYRFSGKSLQFAITFFQNRLSNLIVSRRSTFEDDSLYLGRPVFGRFNSGNSLYRGIETNFQWNIIPESPLFIEGSLSLLGVSGLDGIPLYRIPPSNGRLRVFYKKNNFLLGLSGLGASGQSELSQEDMADPNVSEEGTQGWFILQAFGRHDFVWGSISLRGENLLNRAYRMHGSGLDGYGRSLWLGLRVFL